MKRLYCYPLLSVLVMLGMLVAGLAACAAPPPEATPTPPPPPPEEIKTVVVAFNSGVVTLDPAVACDNEAGTVISNLYDQLVQKGTRRGPAGSLVGDATDIQPELATSWTVSADAREFTFTLRDGVKFTNGHPLNAAAVKYSLDRTVKMMMSGEYALTAGLSGNVESVEAPDDHTVVVRLGAADPLFLEALTLFGASVVDPEEVEGHGGVEEGTTNEYMASHAIGSGPYMVVSYDPETEIVLEANPDYWGPKPPVDRLVIKVVKDPGSRELLLRSGSLDLAFRVPLKDLARLEGEGLRIVVNPSPEITYIGLNNVEPPLNDVKLRQALLYAVPYERLLEEVLHGYGTQLEGPIPSTMPYYCPDISYPYEYDLDKAQELLDEAGYESISLSLDVRAGFTEHEEIAVILQNEFSKIGVDLTINKLSTAEFEDRVWNFKSQMFITDDQPWINDPGYNLGYNLPCGELYNWAQYCNQQVDEWLIAARHETDPVERADLYCKISQQFTDEAPWIMLFVRPLTAVVSPGVTGYIYDPFGGHLFHMLDKQ